MSEGRIGRSRQRYWAVPLVAFALLMAAWPNLIGALVALACAWYVWRFA